jgi:hypothetical protein
LCKTQPCNLSNGISSIVIIGIGGFINGPLSVIRDRIGGQGSIST